MSGRSASREGRVRAAPPVLVSIGAVCGAGSAVPGPGTSCAELAATPFQSGRPEARSSGAAGCAALASGAGRRRTHGSSGVCVAGSRPGLPHRLTLGEGAPRLRPAGLEGQVVCGAGGLTARRWGLPNQRLKLAARVGGVPRPSRPAAARSVAGRAVGGRAILGRFTAGGSLAAIR
jgi:hypothetical protein